MKKVLHVVLMLGIVLLLSGCSKGELESVDKTDLKAPYLHVLTSSWSGWSSDYEPKEIDYYFELKKEHSYSFPENIGYEVAFTIVDVGDSGITIRFSEKLATSENGRINLSDLSDTYDISFDETLQVVTPTMDEGAKYIFTLHKK